MDSESGVKTDEQLVREGNELARRFYELMGYAVRDGYRFDRATHPQEKMCWDAAVVAYEHVNGSDLESALSGLDDPPEAEDRPASPPPVRPRRSPPDRLYIFANPDGQFDYAVVQTSLDRAATAVAGPEAGSRGAVFHLKRHLIFNRPVGSLTPVERELNEAAICPADRGTVFRRSLRGRPGDQRRSWERVP